MIQEHNMTEKKKLNKDMIVKLVKLEQQAKNGGIVFVKILKKVNGISVTQNLGIYEIMLEDKTLET